MAGGALLLLTTNLVGIALAASATFLVLGFAPFERARKGMGIALVFMLLISAPLFISFRQLVEKDAILEQIPSGEIILAGIPVQVGRISIKAGKPYVVRVVLSSPSTLNQVHVEQLKQLIMDRVDKPVVLEAQFSIRR
jgi:uncharacterized membrane protein